MAVVGELLVAIVGSNAGLSAAIARSEAELRGFSATATSHGTAASAALHGVGMAGAAVAAGTTIMGLAAFKAGADFEAAMELIHTQAGASQAEVNKLTGAVLALGPAVGMTPEQLAAGLYHIESAGLRGARAMEILKVAAMGAQIGNADLETVTNALVAAQFSGIKGTSDMAQTMASLNTIVGTGNMRMEDLASSFSSGILPAAKTFGLSITDVGAALATMTDQGVPAEEAATRLRMTFSLLGAPTDKATGELKSIGLTSRTLADDMRKPNGLMVALLDLRMHMQKAGLDATEQAALLSHAFGGGRSAGTIETLIGSLDKLQGKYTAITAGTGNFGEAWAATNATANQKLDDLHASVDTFTTSLGTGLIPALSGVFGFLNPVAAGMAAWATANPGLAANILLVVGAVGALAAGLLVIGPAIALIASPIGLIIGAVVALGAAWASNWGGMRDIVASVIARVGPMITTLASQAIPMLSAALNWLATNVMPVVAGVFNWVRSSVLPPLGDAFNAVAGWVRSNWPLITNIVGQVAGAVRTAFAVISNVIQVAWPILVGIGRVVFPIIGAAASVLLTVMSTTFKIIGGIWQGAAIAFKAVADGIGAAVGLVSGILNGLVGVVATVGKAIGDFFGWLFGNANQAHATLEGLKPGGASPAIGGKYAGALHPDIIGSLNTAGVNAATLSKGAGLPTFASGGMVPGVGPQLILAHGGETVLPEGRGGQAVSSVRHIHIELGGRELLEYIDRELFGSATNTSSGFGALNPVSGA